MVGVPLGREMLMRSKVSAAAFSFDQEKIECVCLLVFPIPGAIGFVFALKIEKTKQKRSTLIFMAPIDCNYRMK